jgi:hypothetical protein
VSGEKYPNWVAEHALFPVVIAEIIESGGGFSEDPVLAHAQSKEVLCTAALLLLNRLREKPLQTLAQEIYLTLCAYRVAKQGEHDRFFKLATRYTILQQFSYDGTYDYDALHQFLAITILRQADMQLQDITTSSTSTNRKSSSGLLRWIRLWAVKCRRFWATVIVGADELAPSSCQQSV